MWNAITCLVLLRTASQSHCLFLLSCTKDHISSYSMTSLYWAGGSVELRCTSSFFFQPAKNSWNGYSINSACATQTGTLVVRTENFFFSFFGVELGCFESTITTAVHAVVLLLSSRSKTIHYDVVAIATCTNLFFDHKRRNISENKNISISQLRTLPNILGRLPV